MSLHLQQLLPTYFDASRSETSEVWGKDLRFDKGQRVKIVAPSGSGKTSLMHFLYGLRRSYTGSVHIGGTTLGNLDAEGLALVRQQQLSVVLQDLRLFPDRTVLENLEIKRQLAPYHEAEKITEMAARLGLSGKLGARCGTCSYGEQQRVAIIRALLQPFDYLLLDEPFSHLDNRNAEIAMGLMLEEAEARGAAILFADLERVEFFPYSTLLHL
ncbi:ATP-binding cassette domain-containing protein [Flaviaesturariibacter amylovorans]|uniref:ATP-binding cassette domain-containing protein n=1 Tax=Flaviaesturariibacter amylovorans TaxID=1084520 RepID=A0ABP8HB11_9BACT